MPIFLPDEHETDTKQNVIVSGRSGFYFAKKVYDHLAKAGVDDFTLLDVNGKTNYDFAEGETHVVLPGNVRRRNPYLIQCFDTPTNYARDKDELYHLKDAINRAHGNMVTVVLPYYPGRGDKKDEPRSEISASDMARKLESDGRLSGVITMDLHAGQIQGFFNRPVDQLYADPLFLMYLRTLFEDAGIDYSDVVVMAADAGGTKPSRRFAESLYGEPRIALSLKGRSGVNESYTDGILGDVKGKIVIVREDIGDTMGTMKGASLAAYEAGAKQVIACITHLLLDPKGGVPAEEKISEGMFKVITTNTTPKGEKYLIDGNPDITVLDAGLHFAAAIARDSKGYQQQLLLGEEFLRQLYEGERYYSGMLSLPASARSGGNHHRAEGITR